MKKIISCLLTVVLVMSVCTGIVFAESVWSVEFAADTYVNEIDCNKDTENGHVYFYDGNDPQYTISFPTDGRYSLDIQYRMNGESDPENKTVTVENGIYSDSGSIRKTTNEEGFLVTEDVLVFDADKGEQTITIKGLNGVSVKGFKVEAVKTTERIFIDMWNVTEGNNSYYIETTKGYEYISMYGNGVVSYAIDVPVSGIYSISGICCSTDDTYNPNGVFTLTSGEATVTGNVDNQSNTFAYEKNIAEIYLEKGQQTITVSNAGGIKMTKWMLALESAGIVVNPVDYKSTSAGTINNYTSYINCKNDTMIEYDITVQKSGVYELYINNASYFTGYTIHAYVDETAYDTANIEGIGWGQYQSSLVAKVDLTEGTHTLAIHPTMECDINSIMFKEASDTQIDTYKIEAEEYDEANAIYAYKSPDEGGNSYYNLWSNGGAVTLHNSGSVTFNLSLPVYGRYSVDVVYASDLDYPIAVSASGNKISDVTLITTGNNYTMAKAECGEFTGRNVALDITSTKTDETAIQIAIDYIVITFIEELEEPEVVDLLILEPEYSITGLGEDGRFSDDAVVEAKLRITNNISQDKEVNLYLVQYEDGKLVKIAADSANLQNCQTFDLSAKITPQNGNNISFKMFVWDGNQKSIKNPVSLDTSLAGKKIMLMGDSILGNYDGAYEEKMGALTGAQISNAAIGGTTWTYMPENSQNSILSLSNVAEGLTTEGYDWSSAVQYGENVKDPEYTQYPNEIIAKRVELLKTADVASYDYLAIWCGVNDFMNGLSISNDENDTQSVTVAVTYTLDKLTKAYPDLKIAVFLPMYTEYVEENSLGKVLSDYSQEIKAAAERFDNVYIFDMYEISGINAENQNIYFSDKLHPRWDWDASGVSPIGMLSEKIVQCLCSVK